MTFRRFTNQRLLPTVLPGEIVSQVMVTFFFPALIGPSVIKKEMFAPGSRGCKIMGG